MGPVVGEAIAITLLVEQSVITIDLPLIFIIIGYTAKHELFLKVLIRKSYQIATLNSFFHSMETWESSI